MTSPDIGIDVGGRVIILGELQTELEGGGVALPNGLVIAGPARDQPTMNPYPPLPEGSRLFTYDDQGVAMDLPAEAEPIVAAYTPEIPSP